MPITRRNAPMRQQHMLLTDPIRAMPPPAAGSDYRLVQRALGRGSVLAAAALAAVCAPAVQAAIDVTAGDWKLSFTGNVNADYIYAHCAALDNNVAVVVGGL